MKRVEDRYSRNRLFVTPEEQSQIAQCKLFFGGSGLGSNIAECALRFGFENICIVDGDTIELSNLNRQNYVNENVGYNKSEVLCNRLRKINPDANITYMVDFLNADNISEYLVDTSIAINALDFSSDVPFLFDEYCIEHKIPVLHPYNLSLAGFVTIVDTEETLLSQLGSWNDFELKMGNFIIENLKEKGESIHWLADVVNILKEENQMPLPQLSVGSWITAGLCVSLLFKIATRKKYKSFPEYYYLSAM